MNLSRSLRLMVAILTTLSVTGTVTAKQTPVPAEQEQQQGEPQQQGEQQQEEEELQEQEEQSNEDSDLPTNAIWRYGDIGKLTRLNGFYRVKFSPDGKLMATRSQANLLSLIDVETNQTLFEFKGYEDQEWIQNIDFSPDSKFMVAATVGSDEKIAVWNTATGERHLTLDEDGKAAFFRNANEICVLQEGVVHVFSFQTGKKISSLKWGRSSETPLTCSRDGSKVVSYRSGNGKNRHSIFVTDVLNQTSTPISTSVPLPRRMVVSEDGNLLAGTFSREKYILVWDLRDPGRPSGIKLEAHEDTVESVCFSPDSRFLATTGWDSQVHIWDVLTRQQIGTLAGHDGHVTASGFSPQGFTLATGANGRTDCSILVWDFRSLVFSETAGNGNEPAEFEELWETLTSDDARLALNAVAELIDNPEYEKQIAEKLGLESAESSEEKIGKWIAQLSSPRFALRLEAEEQLKKWRTRAEPLLQATLRRDDLLREVRYRIARILRQPIQRPKIAATDLRRLHRLIYAMQLSGSEQAQQVLQSLANTHDHVDVARDAFESFARLQSTTDNQTGQ